LCSDAPDGFMKAVRWVRGVAEDEAGWSRPVPVPRQWVDHDATRPDGSGELNVIAVPVLLGQRDEQVEPGSYAFDPGVRQVFREGGEHGVAPLPLPVADSSEVLVVLPGRDQVGEDELREGGAAEVAGVPRGDQVCVPVRRWDEPAHPHAWGERLGRAAGVGDVVGGRWLQGADRDAVVAVLGVVVVLDDEPAISCPCQ